MITGVGFDPMLVVLRPLPQRLLGKGVDAVPVAEEIDKVLRAGEQREIALDDDTVETVVYEDKQAGKQLAEGFHRSSFPLFSWATRSSDGGPWKSSVCAYASRMLG